MTTDRLEDWRKTMKIIVDCKNGIYPQDIHEDRIPQYICVEQNEYKGSSTGKNATRNNGKIALPSSGLNTSATFSKYVSRAITQSDISTLVPIAGSKKSLAMMDTPPFENVGRHANISLNSQNNFL